MAIGSRPTHGTSSDRNGRKRYLEGYIYGGHGEGYTK
jgi:hypothetical protein